MLKLHFAPRTISVAVAIVLEETNTDYIAVPVNFAAAEQAGAAYRAINPKGRVPALETARGILTETGAILEFVAPQLVPADPLAAAQMRELMYYLASTMHVNHAHKLRGARWVDEESSFADMTRKVPQTMAASCYYLEEFLPPQLFGRGCEMVLSDAYLYVVLTWLPGDGVDVSRYPHIQAFMRNMRARPSVLRIYEKGML